MASSKCLRCGYVTDTLAASGLCTICGTDTEQRTWGIGLEAPTLTRDPHDTATQDSAAEWAGVLPAGGYKYDPEPIDGGGMGVVWRAVRVSTGEVFAIKKLRPESYTPTGLRRFVLEAQSLAAVKHEHVVRLYDFVPDPSDPYLVLEYVPGDSLGNHIKHVGPLHPDRAARLMADAALAVEAAHAAGIVHRDLKPGNLLLTLEGDVKVADFGLSKVLAEADVPSAVGATTSGESNTPIDTGTLTATGRLAGGTPGFMAPEQVSEEYGEVGVRSDVWGLGACLYAALTAQAPFPGGKANVRQVLTDPLTPPHQIDPKVPADLSAIVVKCLTKDLNGRYESAAAVAADLKRYLGGESTTANPHPWARRVWRRVRKATVVAVLVTAALAAAVAVVLASNPPDTQQEHQAALRARRPVTLVPEDGPPRWHRWLAGGAIFSPNAMRDGGVQFQTAEDSYLCLLDDPVVDSYRLEAEVRHAAARPPAGRVGLFVGFADHPDPAGGVMRCYCRWQFSDYWDHAELDNLAQPTHAATLSAHCEHQAVPGDMPKSRMTYLDRYRFAPALLAAGRWRKVAVEVTAAGVAAFWWDDKADTWVRAARADAARISGKRKEWADALAASLARPVAAPAWSPRGAVGVFASNGTVCLRNVTLTPLE